MPDGMEDIKLELQHVARELTAMAGAIDELRATRRALLSTAAMEEQAVSVVKSMSEKWHTHTEAIARTRESVESLVLICSNMKRSFDALYNELIDIIHCPIPNIERRSIMERRSHDQRNDSADAGGHGAQ